MDWLTPEGVIVDLKTCEDASPVGFARSVAKFRYHVQAAFYQQGLNEHNITGFEKFIFIAVEKSAPFNIGIYKLDYEAIEQGELEIARNLETYRICKETNRWGGYATEVQKLSLPKYAFI
jgi:exodeoxyribonuclease VIII